MVWLYDKFANSQKPVEKYSSNKINLYYLPIKQTQDILPTHPV